MFLRFHFFIYLLVSSYCIFAMNDVNKKWFDLKKLNDPFEIDSDLIAGHEELFFSRELVLIKQLFAKPTQEEISEAFANNKESQLDIAQAVAEQHEAQLFLVLNKLDRLREIQLDALISTYMTLKRDHLLNKIVIFHNEERSYDFKQELFNSGREINDLRNWYKPYDMATLFSQVRLISRFHQPQNTMGYHDTMGVMRKRRVIRFTAFERLDPRDPYHILKEAKKILPRI